MKNTIDFLVKCLLFTFSNLLLVSIVHANCDRPLVMGYEAYGNFLILDENKKITGGLDFEIMESAFKIMGCKLEWEHLPWKRLLKEVKDGRRDLASGANATDERAEWSYFSESYREAYNALFIRPEDAKRIVLSDLGDLTNTEFKVSAQKGSYLGKEYAELSKNPKFMERIYEVNTDEIAFKMLKKKRLDGVLMNIYTGKTIAKKVGMKVNVHPNINLKKKKYIVLFSKKSTNKDLVSKFNKALKKMHSDGTIKKLMAKYFSVQSPN
jgi:polar amino acid transport system substrate-binding protein